MVYQTWRQCFKIKITHAVRTYHHGTLVFIELVHNTLQSVLTTIQIVAIQLNGKASTPHIAHSQIPTTANTQIIPFGHNKPAPVVLSRNTFHYLPCTVSGVIVHNQHIILEIRLLRQGRPHRILNSPYTVAHRDNNRSLAIKRLMGKRHVTHLILTYQRTNPAQMLRTYRLHLQLHLPVPRIHIVKLLLARLAQIPLLLRI